MKKTVQSLMTAAMFAATASAGLGAMPDSNPAIALEDQLAFTATTSAPLYGPPQTDEPEITTAPPTTTTEVDTTIMTLYGPPYVFPDYPDFTDWDEGTDTTTSTTTVETPPVLYGPPSVLYEHGDENFDHKLDARDLSLLKRRLLNGTRFWDEALEDVDNDGDLDIDDIKALRRKITGKSKEQEEQEELEELQLIETTITTSLTTTLTTTPTTTTMVTSTLYGPPPVAD